MKSSNSEEIRRVYRIIEVIQMNSKELIKVKQNIFTKIKDFLEVFCKKP